MKQRDARRTIVVVTLMVFLGILAIPPALQAAVNTGLGDIAGVDADLVDSNALTINSSTLSLVKRGFLTNGTPVPDGSTLPRGTLVQFLIYINNNTAFPVNDVSVQDVLAAGFAYQAGTLKTDNTVANCALAACTAAEETAIYNAVNATAPETDAIDADAVSYVGASTTVHAGNQNVANSQVNVNASSVWALLFTVRMQ